MFHSHSSHQVKQTASLCLVKLLRIDPKAISHSAYAPRFIQLINDKHIVSIVRGWTSGRDRMGKREVGGEERDRGGGGGGGEERDRMGKREIGWGRER